MTQPWFYKKYPTLRSTVLYMLILIAQRQQQQHIYTNYVSIWVYNEVRYALLTVYQKLEYIQYNGRCKQKHSSIVNLEEIKQSFENLKRLLVDSKFPGSAFWVESKFRGSAFRVESKFRGSGFGKIEVPRVRFW